MDDLLYRRRREAIDNNLHMEDDTLKNLRLLEIEQILNRNGRSLKDFPLMPMPSVRDAHFVINKLIREELEYDIASEHQMFDELFAELSVKYKDHSYLKERGILAPKSTDVDELNSIMLSMIPGESRTYLSADTLCPTEKW
ncbi:hypothetical protein Vadar_023330 [Vaccinium darrowii]|uniref:Uncharacterized protein n=1 Tax=Vaccinium darrowii TaxID=229202 RepID=A0ACB7XTE8_9ERIC|nr:hypothetical protein Vadar_023330 [Vaccinium darrowii]